MKKITKIIFGEFEIEREADDTDIDNIFKNDSPQNIKDIIKKKRSK